MRVQYYVIVDYILYQSKSLNKMIACGCSDQTIASSQIFNRVGGITEISKYPDYIKQHNQ